ncbi:NAD(P)-binding protein [Zopfia rhizophila CBS 207.26]|uniref:NAD(P)-binding protein n=1 Tax=Zopfia rhizophila CBS 207.26 TaxID=1314779 RepID=A0A6A6DKN9_9PEZI|nr:NAD(P)-binding protein [Zopfia rhizophila CBS 207.26]
MAGVPPPWTGLTFTYPKLHSTPPASLAPSNQKLPSPFVVAIMGGSRNIGAKSAKAFAAAGATGIVITSTNEEALNKTKADADVGDSSAAKLIADTVQSTYGRLDVLINNAAIVSTDASAFAKLHGINLENIEKTMQVNYVGKFSSTKALLPLLLKTTDGAKTIVNITSARGTGYGDGRRHAMRCILGIVKEKRQWLSGRYLSANWDVEELEGKKEAIVSEDKLKMRMVV